MGKGAAPKPPDPEKTAAAQTASNIATATAQANINNVDQSTPLGQLKYTQTGTNPDGTPKYSATQTYSPGVQTALDNATSAVSKPLDLSNGATEARLMELGNQRLQPLLDQRRASSETDLINRGIRPGSTNYDSAQANINQGENDAYNQLLLNGRQQSVSEALAARNQPINEFLSLSGGNPSLPTSQVGVAGTDLTSLVNNKYQADSQAYQQKQSDLYGGLFGLGKAAIGAFSDKRLKTNIRSTGEKMAGVPVKTWDWKGSGKRDVGVIAQDVEKKFPHLVQMDPSGYRKVNYAGLMRRAG